MLDVCLLMRCVRAPSSATSVPHCAMSPQSQEAPNNSYYHERFPGRISSVNRADTKQKLAGRYRCAA
jgi:hypothetical protein